LAANHAALFRIAEIGDDLPHGEHADATTMNPMPSESSVMPKLKRCTPVLTSVPTMPRQKPERHHGERLRHVALGQHGGRHQAHQHQGKIFRRANSSATSASGGPNRAISSVPTVPAKERADRCDGERRTGAALAGHLIAVDAGDD